VVQTSSSRIPVPGEPSSSGRGTALLASKLAPASPASGTVLRPRLIRLLTEEVQRCPLTLISGPAGSGKTVLATSWRNSQTAGRPIAWLTLDYLDDDPATFWNYVIEALTGAGVPLSVSADLPPGEPPPPWLVPRLATDIGWSQQTVVLVIDNADDISSRSIIAGLDLLVTDAGGALRLVLSSRADPPLPLHRYRLAGTLGEIRTDQLALTVEETQDLLAAAGVPVPAEVARGLQAETGGWAVGLRCAAGPLKQGVSPEQLVTSLAHDDGSVAQYLFAEVLERQPPAIRRDLLRVSVTSDLHPDLIDRLCGHRNVRRVLAGLARANAFVEESPGAPGGLRIHPLFREMLQAQLDVEHPDEFARLHSVCAEWYAEQGRPRIAIVHAVTAEDWDIVTRLLIDNLLVCHLLAHGTDAVLGGLRSLPPGVPGPDAAVIRTVAAVTAGLDVAPSDLATAASVCDGAGVRPELRLSATLAVLVASPQDDLLPADLLARVASAAAVMAGLADEGGGARLEGAAVLTDLRAGGVLRSDAPNSELLAALRAAAAAALSAGSRRLRRRAVAALALVEAVQGDLTRACSLALEAEASADEDGLEEERREAAAATALAWVHLRRFAVIEAREWLLRAGARETGTGRATVDIGPVNAVLQAQQLRLRHEYDVADGALLPHRSTSRTPRWIAEQVLAETVRLAVARGDVAGAEAALGDADRDQPWSRRLRAAVDLAAGRLDADADPDDGEPPDSPAGAVESAVLRACRLAATGRTADAVQVLSAALELARPELLRLPFIDVPLQGRRLLRTAALQSSSAWVNPSSGAQPRSRRPAAPAAEPQSAVVQELSSREMEVLRYLAAMLSTAEIAATMFISVNTVRTHIRSILRKLGVSRRNQAVRRARERGLLPPVG
jgi:LuxR family transcriptional regulator, maltose regulon positive regulatory protein